MEVRSLPADFPAGLQVLVVLDAARQQDDLLDLLRQLRYSVTTCQRCQDALALLDCNSSLELLLVENSLLSGDQDEQHLQTLAARLPLVLLSDKPGSSESVWQGLHLGAAEVLERPLSLLKLRNIWQHVVRKRLATQDKERRPSRWLTQFPAQGLQVQSGSPNGPLSFSFSGLGEQRSKSLEPEHSQGALDQADSSDSNADLSGQAKRQRTQDCTAATPPHPPAAPPAWGSRWLSSLLPHQTPHPVPGCVWGTPLASRPSLHTPWPGPTGPASQSPGLGLPGGCCMPAAALQAARSNLATSGPSTMVPVDKPSAGSELGVLAPHPQAGDLPPIGLSLRKSESLLDLVNQHLACVQG